MSNTLPVLLALTSTVLLGACFGGGSSSDADSTLPNASTLSSVTISGTTDEVSTVRVNGLSDSNTDPNAFNVTVPVSEDATGAILALMVTATDGDLNGSSKAIDLTIAK